MEPLLLMVCPVTHHRLSVLSSNFLELEMHKVAVGIVFRAGRKTCDCTKRWSYLHRCPNQYFSIFEIFLQRRCLQFLMFLISNIVAKVATSVHFYRHWNSFFAKTTAELLQSRSNEQLLFHRNFSTEVLFPEFSL